MLGTKRRVEDVGGGVAGEEDGAVKVVGVETTGAARRSLEGVEVVEGALAEGGGGFEAGGGGGGRPVVAAELHAVVGLAADRRCRRRMRGGAEADGGAFGVDDEAVHGGGAEVGGAVLDGGGEGLALVEAACLGEGCVSRRRGRG